ncbi:MAG: carbohydrate ABC transporter permease [Clostridia bacterium]|nr:carbohydrate ABC transporter permease [Clostridia bacterium]
MDKKVLKRSLNPFGIIMLIILLVYSLSLFIPLAFGLLTSFKQVMDFGAPNKNVIGLPNWELWQNDPHNPGNIFGNYIFSLKYMEFQQNVSYIVGIFNKRMVTIIVKNDIWDCLVNTLLYAIGSGIASAFGPMLMGYLCAKYRGKGASFFYAIVLFVMATPIVGTQPTSIELNRALGIYNEIWGFWITNLTFTNMYFLVFYAFFYGLSDTYSEAAEIDGASQFRTMFQINMPLALNIFYTIFLLRFIYFWNDYNTPMLYLPTKPTLAYGIYYVTERMTGAAVNLEPRKTAILMMFAMPILALFIAFRDKLMGNLSMGGIKE